MPARIERAVTALGRLPSTRVTRLSHLYRNPPMGPGDQPDYVNAVAELHTRLAPLELLRHLQAIEDAEGRTRGKERWQARSLDLDLLLHGQRRARTAELTLPHPGLHLRAFVVHPLAEIAPEVEIPGHGRAASLAARLPADDLVRLDRSG